ncbi:MAG: hypothetical protein WD557_05320 [Dehalococcoidia bacterium]
MDVVVTDLTRMRGGHICIAGIDLATGDRVRPKLAGVGLPDSVAAVNGGTVRTGSLLRLADPWLVPSAPEIEDVIVPERMFEEHLRLSAPEFVDVIRGTTGDIERQIESLERRGRSLVVAEGMGHGSLAVIKAPRPLRVALNDFGRIRATYDGLDLSVTDLRLYAGAAVDPGAVSRLAGRLRSGEVVLAVGLTRPFSPNEEPPVHWLQVNGVHLMDDPYW